MAEDVYLKFENPAWSGDKALIGESMDESHPGKEGWIQIKSFSFGFGAGDASAVAEAKTYRAKAKTLEDYQKEDQDREKAKARKETKVGGKSWGKSGPLDFDKFSFTKSADLMSSRLVAICHKGDIIPKVHIEAVRYGGSGTEMRDIKIPFLRLIFENVHLKSIKLNLTNEDLPSEDIDFEYDVVRMESIWTDNATGNRLPQEPIRAGWNLPGQKPAS